ncbi:MAG: ABC transporter permease subunit [Candidatus Firestonebacteria bacterium]
MEKHKLNKILAVAQNVLNECIRHKVLNILFVFALALIGGSLLIEELSPGAQGRTLINVGYANMEIFGFFTIMLSIFIMTFEEVEMRNLWLSLTKPISRGSYLTGKFLGITFVLLLTMSVMSVIIMGISFISKVSLNFNYLLVVFSLSLGLMLAIALTLAFISITTNLATGLIFSSFVFMIGHLTEHLKTVIENPKTLPAVKGALALVYYLAPNFSLFNLKDKVYMADGTFDLFYILQITVYAAIYTFIALYIGIKVFRKKEL